MTVLTQKTKAQLMRAAFAKLASDYVNAGRTKDAASVVESLRELSGSTPGIDDESIVRLFDILDSVKPAHPLARFEKYVRPQDMRLNNSHVLGLMRDRAIEAEGN